MCNMVTPQIDTCKKDRTIKSIQPPGRKTIVQFPDTIVVMPQVKRQFLPDRFEPVDLLPPADMGDNGLGRILHGDLLCLIDGENEPYVIE